MNGNSNNSKKNNQLNNKEFNINAFISKHNAVKSYFNGMESNEERNEIKQLVSMMGSLGEEELIKMAKLLPFFTVLASITVQNAVKASRSLDLAAVQGAMAQSLGAAADVSAAVASGQNITAAASAFESATAALIEAGESAEDNAGPGHSNGANGHNARLLTKAVTNAENAGEKTLTAVENYEENPTPRNAGNVVNATVKAANAAETLAGLSGNQQASNNAVKAANNAEKARLALNESNSSKLVTAATAAANATLGAAEGVRENDNGMEGGASKKAPKKAPKKKAVPKKKPTKK